MRVQSRWWAEVLGWEIACEGDDDEGVALPPYSADKAREMLATSGLTITAATDLTDAARKIVALAKKAS